MVAYLPGALLATPLRVAFALLLIADVGPNETKAMDMASRELESLRKEPKFQPDKWYTGPDTPEDGPQLVALVNATIDDISTMPRPLTQDAVRNRLSKLINDVDLFATEDRDQMYIYAIRIWRAAGFVEESRLFPVSDDRVLQRP